MMCYICVWLILHIQRRVIRKGTNMLQCIPLLHVVSKPHSGSRHVVAFRKRLIVPITTRNYILRYL